MTLSRFSTPSANLIRPPVGLASGTPQPWQRTGTVECEKAVVRPVQELHRSEMYSERGFGTNVFFLHVLAS